MAPRGLGKRLTGGGEPVVRGVGRGVDEDEAADAGVGRDPGRLFGRTVNAGEVTCPLVDEEVRAPC